MNSLIPFFSGVFLPGLVEPDLCRGKDGQLNKPLCLAWSSNGHNHYIALVGVKGRPPPRLPGWMMPKSWGMPQQLLPKYIDLHQDQGCVIGGTKCLGVRVCSLICVSRLAFLLRSRQYSYSKTSLQETGIR